MHRQSGQPRYGPKMIEKIKELESCSESVLLQINEKISSTSQDCNNDIVTTKECIEVEKTNLEYTTITSVNIPKSLNNIFQYNPQSSQIPLLEISGPNTTQKTRSYIQELLHIHKNITKSPDSTNKILIKLQDSLEVCFFRYT